MPAFAAVLFDLSRRVASSQVGDAGHTGSPFWRSCASSSQALRLALSQPQRLSRVELPVLFGYGFGMRRAVSELCASLTHPPFGTPPGMLERGTSPEKGACLPPFPGPFPSLRRLRQP